MNDLVREAVGAGGTDILLTPGTGMGKLMVRAAGETLIARTVEPEVLASLTAQIPMAHAEEATIASYEVDDADGGRIAVRVIATPTPRGPMMRLRLQPQAMLAQALQSFRDGRFGGLEVRAHLRSRDGVVFIAGLVSGGKTSALHHLVSDLDRRLTLVSEAAELPLRGARLAPTIDLGFTASMVRASLAEVVAIDEMDETDKLALALDLARDRLVIATLAAPNVEAALRRVRGALSEPPHAVGHPVIGFLRVGWRVGESALGLRRPEYAWYGFQRHPRGACPCCGLAPGPSRCEHCGAAGATHLIPVSVLSDMDDLEAYRAGERLEPASSPRGTDATMPRSSDPPWKVHPSRN